MALANINRFIQLFSQNFKAMHADVPMHEIEQLSMFVHSSMDQKWRAYHTSSHAFDMCEDMNPRQALVGLFHDVVYYQLDGGFPSRASKLLEPVVRIKNDTLILRDIDPEDSMLWLCASIFGFLPGQTLPVFCGMNEFLSAVVAVRLLEPFVSSEDMIAIVAGIEATIPFRGADANGRGMADLLADRVREQCRLRLKDRSIEVIDHVVDEVTREAVLIANSDVGGFSEPDPSKFLAVTWLLIEESNAPLAAVGVYSMQDYRRALSRMERFLGSLNPDTVFHQYKHYPDDATFASLNAAARKNITFACDYLSTKITSIAIIEALALETGGNCPVSMFLGDIRNRKCKPDRVEDFLSPNTGTAAINPEVLDVLENGRAQESSNDLTASPLTAFIYRYMGVNGTRDALQQAKRMFDEELAPHEFLQQLDHDLVVAIIDACAQIAISRRELLHELKKSLN
jgi:hypothetical protein